MARDPSQEYVRQRLDYDPATGLFAWKPYAGNPRKWNSKWAGKTTGLPQRWKYIGIALDNKRFYAHRLAWIHVHGAIPEGLQIDHINRNRQDNRIANLRVATVALNSANCVGKSKKGLPKGVVLHAQSGKYYAKIRANGQRLSCGYYTTPEEAGAAYLAAYEIVHGVEQ